MIFMKNKDKILGFFFIALAIGLWTLELRRAARSQDVEDLQEANLASEIEEAKHPHKLEGKPETQSTSLPLIKQSPEGPKGPKELASAASQAAPLLVVLENSVLRVTFTSQGGAIASVAFKDYPDTVGSKQCYRFRHEEQPALGLAFKGNQGQLNWYQAPFRLLYQDAEHIQWAYTTPEGIEIVRGYSLAKQDEARDPYVIFHETAFNNPTQATFSLPEVFVGLGLAPYETVDIAGYGLSLGFMRGEKATFKDLGTFLGSKGFLGMGARKPLAYFEANDPSVGWACVKNQFFANVLTPSNPGQSVYGCLTHLSDGEEALSGALGLGPLSVEAGKRELLQLRYYTGPKAYRRLEGLGKGEEHIMEFGPLAFISKILLASMIGIHAFAGNWGLTIILLTCIIKLLLWPLTAKATQSARRMAALQAPMKVLREKHKANPQKLQREMAELFKKQGVNPAAGCLPLLVQIPIFLALFWMLRSASELRFASFLWVTDLSSPDTVATLGSFPINIMPLFMGISMFFQMRMTPSTGTEDAQQKILRFLPFIFLFVCYNFSSGLVLYWTVQNVITILQQSLSKEKKEKGKK